MNGLIQFHATACAVIILAAISLPAKAQHASDNAVTAAEDAFGLTLGLESIGMYSPGQVRGFSPQSAGNVRIDGLYFDQQGQLSNRVVEGSTIRVGVSEIGYAFPAPTGIVDYGLRHSGDGTPSASIIASAGPYEARGLSIDGSIPLDGNKLLLPIGASSQISTQTPYGSYPGYTSRVNSAGATPQWSPNDKVTVRALVDWQQTRAANTFPVFLSAGDDLPPPLPRGYLGQNWAQGQSLSLNFGGLVAAQLTPHWSLNAGLFRSRADNPASFADLYTNIQPSGQSEHLLVGYPDQRAASTSGEVRLTGRFTSGDWHQELIGLARGRETLALYGGDATFDAGTANIGAGLQIPAPLFSYSQRTHDRTELWSVGSAYRIKWRTRVQLEIGLQEENYRKDVSSPGIANSELTDRPLRTYANAALGLTSRLTLYTNYTQGLEDSGVAPGAAENRGAVLPASRTWQVESGLRFAVTPRLNIITGVYELQKPYFNLDTANNDRELGVQRAKGFEFSIAGQPFEHLHINAGILEAKVSIIGHDLAAEGVGPIAVGQPRMQYVANIDYSLPWWPVLSLDAGAIHFGSEPASVDNRIYSPQVTQWNLGGRYKADAFGKHFTLRVLVENVPNSNEWTNVYTPGYFLWPGPRTVFAYLTADL